MPALGVPFEDAAEAEARALFLSDDPLGDSVPTLNVAWTVKEVEPLQEALLSDPRLQAVPFDAASFSAEDSPPPKAVFTLSDRPQPRRTPKSGPN